VSGQWPRPSSPSCSASDSPGPWPADVQQARFTRNFRQSRRRRSAGVTVTEIPVRMHQPRMRSDQQESPPNFYVRLRPLGLSLGSPQRRQHCAGPQECHRKQIGICLWLKSCPQPIQPNMWFSSSRAGHHVPNLRKSRWYSSRHAYRRSLSHNRHERIQGVQ
jgi:hypothetical protein